MPKRITRRKPQDVRKARFEAALKLAGMTAQDFAKVNDTNPVTLHYVARGARSNDRLNAAIDDFIARHLPQPITAAAGC